MLTTLVQSWIEGQSDPLINELDLVHNTGRMLRTYDARLTSTAKLTITHVTNP